LKKSKLNFHTKLLKSRNGKTPDLNSNSGIRIGIGIEIFNSDHFFTSFEKQGFNGFGVCKLLNSFVRS
jgi:hypothetical protein